jgi:hypothetical protein
MAQLRREWAAGSIPPYTDAAVFRSTDHTNRSQILINRSIREGTPMDFAAIFARVQRLLISPTTEWDAIAAEPADMQQIYMNYVGPLVIASAIASAIGLSLIGVNLPFGGTFRYPAMSALTSAIVSAGLGLIMVYVLAVVINALATQFEGTPDMGQAFKLAAYAPTAAWVASLLNIIPALGIIALLGSAYSLYLLFVGLPKLMKPAEDKAVTYTIVVVVIMIVVGFVIGSISSAMLPSMTPVWRVN